MSNALSTPLSVLLLICSVILAGSRSASAQIVEAVGSRALGMGGAFVAVASDSSATWWNPAGLAAGPFVDIALAHAVGETPQRVPVRRDRVTWFALGTPPLGLSYYRVQTVDVRQAGPTGAGSADRQGGSAGVQVRSWSGGQLGVTVLHTLVSGVHAGATLKYLRGRAVHTVESQSLPVSSLLAQGDALEGGRAEGRFDVDLGVLAVLGPMRLGGVVRNLRRPMFGNGEFTVPRQVRAGVAFDADRAGGTLIVAADADLRTYRTAVGERRVVALGGERWLMRRRIALRAGGRFNTAGAQGASGTGGISVSVRSGLLLEGHFVRGGAAEERGWGAAMRVSF